MCPWQEQEDKHRKDVLCCASLCRTSIHSPASFKQLFACSWVGSRWYHVLHHKQTPHQFIWDRTKTTSSKAQRISRWLFWSASKCNCSVQTRPNELHQVGKQTRVQLNWTRKRRSENALRWLTVHVNLAYIPRANKHKCQPTESNVTCTFTALDNVTLTLL